METNIWKYWAGEGQLIMRFLLVFLLLLAACQKEYRNSLVDDEPKYNTEIVCPNSSYRFLVLQSTKAETEESIRKAIEYHLKSNKKNRYTILYFPNNRTTSIYNMTPQEVQRECLLIERPRKLKDIY